MVTSSPTITAEQKIQFRDDGCMVLESVIPPEHLCLLREELDRLIAEVDATMTAGGTDVEGLNHRGKRYFINNRHRPGDGVGAFLYSQLMADICRATIGDRAFLFLEQFVVKMAEVENTFSWHQDSGYLKQQIGVTAPYLTCWCALDDMSEANGTIYILPYSRAGSREVVDHVRDPSSNDQVGYFGDDPGMPVLVPAGSVVAFSTDLFHRSGANRTGQPRRSYVVQYSAEPILGPDGTPHVMAHPFLEGGVRLTEG